MVINFNTHIHCSATIANTGMFWCKLDGEARKMNTLANQFGSVAQCVFDQKRKKDTELLDQVFS